MYLSIFHDSVDHTCAEVIFQLSALLKYLCLRWLTLKISSKKKHLKYYTGWQNGVHLHFVGDG